MLMGVIMYHIMLYISFYFPHQFTDGIAGRTLMLQERQQQQQQESHFELVVDLADFLDWQRMILLRLILGLESVVAMPVSIGEGPSSTKCSN
jgi:hypothetical protein